jgi:hypothetical protein
MIKAEDRAIDAAAMAVLACLRMPGSEVSVGESDDITVLDGRCLGLDDMIGCNDHVVMGVEVAGHQLDAYVMVNFNQGKPIFAEVRLYWGGRLRVYRNCSFQNGKPVPWT